MIPDPQIICYARGYSSFINRALADELLVARITDLLATTIEAGVVRDMRMSVDDVLIISAPPGISSNNNVERPLLRPHLKKITFRARRSQVFVSRAATVLRSEARFRERIAFSGANRVFESEVRFPATHAPKRASLRSTVAARLTNTDNYSWTIPHQQLTIDENPYVGP